MILAIVFVACPPALFAQQGTAKSGYHPTKYGGQTFTGTVTLTNDATREVTLTRTDPKKGKTETLVCFLAGGYTVKLKDGTSHELKPSDIKLGAVIKVHCAVGIKEAGGKRTPVNTIILISRVPSAGAQSDIFKAFN
jgi:hypothetical protein